jgi:rhodanese-related sulfurtransferase
MDDGNAKNVRIEIVDPQTARLWFERGEVVLVDVREPHEFANEHVEGATLIPLSAFDSKRIPDHAGKKLMIMCASGIRCGIASEMLVQTGYRELYRLAGGIMGWKAAGGPIRAGN